MDRRKSIKTLFVGTVSTGVLLEACDAPATDKTSADAKMPNPAPVSADRMREELEWNAKIVEGKFFTPHEIATVGVLADIIIPKDDKSGSATDARVPDFIEFMMLDKPENQTPMRGGLRWLDLTCMKRYEKSFIDCTDAQRIELVDQIAYPKKTKPDMIPGSNFFSLIRNFTVTGFYTSKIGIEDIGFMGNRPNKWNGVPDDVLKQYDMAYTERELKECASYDKA